MNQISNEKVSLSNIVSRSLNQHLGGLSAKPSVVIPPSFRSDFKICVEKNLKLCNKNKNFKNQKIHFCTTQWNSG